jgi:prolyl 4-hydroxylase
MKKINLPNQKAINPHFIGSWNLENNTLCEKIISLFEENKKLQIIGVSGKGFNEKLKKTIDITFKPSDLSELKFKCLNDYIAELYKCFADYRLQWPFLKKLVTDVDIGSFNIQKYSPGGHFANPHAERSGLDSLHRVFAWMTYLNDVEDGGETDFKHYDIKVKPEIGKTLIWPAEWTHTHSGEVLNSGVKYIITGWMDFPVN